MYSGCNLWYFKLGTPRGLEGSHSIRSIPTGTGTDAPEEKDTGRPTDLKVSHNVSEFPTVFYTFEQGVFPLRFTVSFTKIGAFADCGVLA